MIITASQHAKSNPGRPPSATSEKHRPTKKTTVATVVAAMNRAVNLKSTSCH
jgi:hypothetical protein